MAWLFDTEHWREAIDTLRANRARSLLAATGVFWGVFLLVTMLGMGNGLRTGVLESMRGFAANSIYLWGTVVSRPHRGFEPGRHVLLNNADVKAIRSEVPGVEHVCPRIMLPGYPGGAVVRHHDRAGTFSVSGDVPEYSLAQPLRLLAGRFINHLDIDRRRKVAVIGTGVESELFVAPDDPIGALLEINGVFFQVVGRFAPVGTGQHADNLSRQIIVPFSTFQSTFNRPNRVGWLALTVRPGAKATDVEQRARAVLAKRHHVAPNDPEGIASQNTELSYRRIVALFRGIQFLIWLVGTATLLAGVIGVGNIMLITVKERTKEIGVRRAVGATAGSIVRMIMFESFLLTAVAGLLGLGLAIFLLDAAGNLVPRDSATFATPGIDLVATGVATVVLLLCGLLAGVLPARAALRVNPAEALRTE